MSMMDDGLGKVQTLLVRIDKTSLGMSGVATPRNDCPYAKSNANTLIRACAYRVFLTSCVGINLGDIPRGLQHPWDVPLVDPSTLGPKTLYELVSLKYCYIAAIVCFSPSPFPPLSLLMLDIRSCVREETSKRGIYPVSSDVDLYFKGTARRRRRRRRNRIGDNI